MNDPRLDVHSALPVPQDAPRAGVDRLDDHGREALLRFARGGHEHGFAVRYPATAEAVLRLDARLTEAEDEAAFLQGALLGIAHNADMCDASRSYALRALQQCRVRP